MKPVARRDAQDSSPARKNRDRLGVSWPALALVALMAAAPAWAGRKNVEAIGSLSCGGQPLVNVAVELVEYRWPGWTDPVIDRGVTDAAGGFSLRGTGGWVFGDPTTYLRVRYQSLVAPAPQKDVRIHDEIGSIRSGSGPRFDYRPGVINMGALSSSGLDCALWQGLDRAVADYRNEADPIAPLPYGGVGILRWSAASAGVPFAMLSTISWPAGFSGRGARSVDTVFHEQAHTVRHSFDGDTVHFLSDVASFGYLRNHNYCDVTNPAYAFNEGWAWFWETRPPAEYGKSIVFEAVDSGDPAFVRALVEAGADAKKGMCGINSSGFAHTGLALPVGRQEPSDLVQRPIVPGDSGVHGSERVHRAVPGFSGPARRRCVLRDRGGRRRAGDGVPDRCRLSQCRSGSSAAPHD
jgi:hypothetical protein